MAANSETDLPPSPYEDSGEEEEFTGFEPDITEGKENAGNNNETTAKNNVENLLKRLQSSGALIKTPKKEYYCRTCKEDFVEWPALKEHLLTHVSSTCYVLLNKVADPDPDTANSDDDNWSDEDDEQEMPQTAPKTPQKIDISQILKKALKNNTGSPSNSTSSALSKLSGLGFTINKTHIKEEKSDADSTDLIKKLGNLGGLKLKLKSEGTNSNSFKVVNGLKDFKTSDNEDSGDEDEPKSGDEMDDSDDDKIKDENNIQDQGTDEEPSLSEGRKSSGSDGSMSEDKPTPNVSLNKKIEPIKILKTSIIKPAQIPQVLKIGRPSVKQTPRRTPTTEKVTTSSNEDSTESTNVKITEIKTEVPSESGPQSTMPLFSEQQQIKSERLSPPLEPAAAMPIIMTTIKTEAEPAAPSTQKEPLFSNQTKTVPLLVPKQEADVIEINCDDDDDDDDCCVVSTTPAPDIKPIIPKVETLPAYPPPSYPSSTSSLSATSAPSLPIMSRLLTSPMSSSQNSYSSYNIVETKPLVDLGEKGVDDIFDTLFSPKKENLLSDTNEYISLDKLGSQHTCDVCNTRFTDPSMLDVHIRNTGHSKSIITPCTSTLLPYNPSPSSALLSSLFPVKQLAEQVGKLSTMGGPGSNPFTHQQNVMINIQAYPGAGGLVPPQTYNSYGGPQSYPPTSNMYGSQSQQMPGQNFPGQNYMGQHSYANQMPYNTMPKTYPGPGGFPSDGSPYPTQSPLQSMQQAVYGQSPVMNTMAPGQSLAPGQSMALGQSMAPGQTIAPNQNMGPGQNMAPGQTITSGQTVNVIGSMGPPLHPPPTSPMKPASGIKIKNIQNLGPGQNIPGGPGLMRAPGPVGIRPRMQTTVRGGGAARGGARPGLSPRARLQGPRMAMKRPGASPANVPPHKRRDMLLPGRHDNEDCHVMSMQKQQEGMPLIQRVQGAKEKLNIGKQITITKKPAVNREASAMANVLASRGIMVKQKQRSRSPSPQRPIPHIPNLGSDVSVKHSGSRSSSFSIPEATVGGGMLSCKICGKMFMNQNSLMGHMTATHPHSKINMFKCDECPASYPKSLQLQHHRRVFHNVSGANRELGLPVVDLSQEDNLRRLKNLGIYSFIPLANREQASGCFGIPVVSAHNANNGMTNTLQALGADGLLSLGPLKPLP